MFNSTVNINDIISNNKNYKDIPVLVTGGAGFIGSHIVKALVNQGARVTILDNLSTGCLDNIKEVVDSVILINQSITDINACLHAAYKQKIIFHCASISRFNEHQEESNFCYNTNILGTHNILEAAKYNKISKIIFSSSFHVYGNSNKPLIEKDTCQPESAYGYSKLIGELLCAQYTRLYNIKSIILRYFNVYSESFYKSNNIINVIDRFKYNMAKNHPITIYGDGTQTRDFVHISKVVEANILLGFLKMNNPINTFNIASGKSITLLKLINRLKQEFDSYNQDINFEPERIDDIKYSYADCSKYHSFLDSIGNDIDRVMDNDIIFNHKSKSIYKRKTL